MRSLPPTSVDRLVKVGIHNHIYWVNNNSSDSSKQIALNISDKHHDISYLETTHEQGKGVGIRYTITRCRSWCRLGIFSRRPTKCKRCFN